VYKDNLSQDYRLSLYMNTEKNIGLQIIFIHEYTELWIIFIHEYTKIEAYRLSLYMNTQKTHDYRLSLSHLFFVHSCIKIIYSPVFFVYSCIKIF
jgi:hypothetical protein